MKKELWIRLREYRFGNLVPPTVFDKIKSAFGETDAFTRAFAAKIARKHGWENEFAFLAIREYKKFIYLGAVSHYDITPSKIIDIVWHEHQLFTRGYREFCHNVIGRQFDHSPELVAFEDQHEVYSAQYQKMLAFYRLEFGTTAPPEIWGTTKFDRKTVRGTVEKPEKKRTDSSDASSDGDTALYRLFTSSSDQAYAPVPVTFKSGEGGDFGGAGASGSWGDATSSPSTPAADTQSTSSCSSSSSSCSSSSSSCGGGE